MARTVELAFLSQSEERDALELARRVLDPASYALPHVTLRHQARRVSSMWRSRADTEDQLSLTLEAPATFDLGQDGSALSTLVLRCVSEDLDLRSYKPDFPTSVPHITLYDGPPSRLAAEALRLLGAMPWNRQIKTRFEVFASSREALAASGSTDFDGELLTASARRLRDEVVTLLGLDPSVRARDRTDAERLAIVAELAGRLQRAGSEAVRPPERAPALVPAGQLSFWTSEEIWAITGQGPEHRRAHNRRTSAFATPPELASDVAESLASLLPSSAPVSFGDPAAGNGVLLAAARRAFGAERFGSAELIELDPASAKLVQQRYARAAVDVIEGDFLKIRPRINSWSVVLANPPYRRSQLVSADTSDLRRSLRDQLAIDVSARSDLYVYFLLRAHAWMKEGALAAWIIPAEFQVTSYGSALRTYLTSHVELLRVHTFDASDPVFDNALTSTSVVVFRKTPARLGQSATLSIGGTVTEPERTITLPVGTLRSAARWSFHSLQGAKSATGPRPRIGDLFEVRRGIATGSNEWFVLDDDQIERLSVEGEWVRPLVPRARDTQDARIRADAGGNPIPASGRWLIDTSEPLDRIARRSPAFADYLRAAQQATVNRALVTRRAFFAKQEHRDPAPFLFAYMVKSDSATPRFLRNDSRGLYLNNYIGLYFREAASGPARDSRYLDAMHERLLQVSTEDLLAQGRLYGKGLLKLEPSDLKRVRLPD